MQIIQINRLNLMQALVLIVFSGICPVALIAKKIDGERLDNPLNIDATNPRLT